MIDKVLKYCDEQYNNYELIDYDIGVNKLDIFIQRRYRPTNCCFCLCDELSKNSTYTNKYLCRPLSDLFVTAYVEVVQYKCKCLKTFVDIDNTVFNIDSIASKGFVDYLDELRTTHGSLRKVIVYIEENFKIKFAVASIFKYLKLKKETVRMYDSITINENENENETVEQSGLVIEKYDYVFEAFKKGDSDRIFPLVTNYADYILEYIDKDCDLIKKINYAFGKNKKRHIDSIPPATYLISTIAARFRNIVATNSMNIAVTSPELLHKLASALYVEKEKSSFFSLNALRKFVLSYRRCEQDPIDKEPNKKVLKHKHKDAKILAQSFNDLFYSLEKATEKMHFKYKNHKIKIIDGTKIEVSDKNKYELAGRLKTNDSQKYVDGYKILSTGILMERGFLFNHFEMGAINDHDLKLAKASFRHGNKIHKNDLFLLDRGFIDIGLIGLIRSKNADVIIPLKSNMEILKDAIVIANKNGDWEKYGKDNEITLVTDMTLFDKKSELSKKNTKTDNVCNVAIVRVSKEKGDDDQFFKARNNENLPSECSDDKYKYVGFLSTDLSFNCKEILNCYKLRWTIETSFKDNKSNWNLNDFKSTFYELILYYLATTFLAYNIGELFKHTTKGILLENISIPLYVRKQNQLLEKARPQNMFIKKDQYYAIVKMLDFLDEINVMNPITYGKLRPRIY